ncbi:nucleoside phosphorylase domain-containing protein [Melanogaster broomeanus]|nr:nucleoside phosphorylase domain-containing protein [Melanogaster broomeanus]
MAKKANTESRCHVMGYDICVKDHVLVGVIGGSGLYHLDNLTFIKTVNIETPWGYPSSPISICSLPSGARVAFLARPRAVGSLREEIAPGHFAIPTQIIDRTKGIRPASFFEGTSVVAHAAFGDPFSLKLVRWLETEVEKALKDEGRGVVLHKDKCLVCMEGPQFSTRAESIMYRAWGADLINMSVIPEAKLAREAELGYALIATATDYDSWRPHSEASAILEDLHLAAMQGDLLSEEKGSMSFSIMPRSVGTKEEDAQKLAYILPEYFKPAN